ncbi:hypothetical protein HJ590_11655 [Naumannella sp. ID2617S]|nr:hypothetical protein [Naumannella sp. ID2617S]
MRDVYLRVALPAAALLLAGCAAGQGVRPQPPAPTSVSVPAGGVSLAQLGFQNGPAAAVTLPRGARIDQRVDQPNVLTATFTSPAPAELAGWLRGHLGEGGFRIIADRGDSLVFVGSGWSGAFTATDALSALTLRKDP